MSNMQHFKRKRKTSSQYLGEKTENQLTDITRTLDVFMSIGAKGDRLLSVKETVDKDRAVCAAHVSPK